LSPHPNPLNDDEFREAIADLIIRARSNGVDITGGWDVKLPGTAGPDSLSVEIFPVVHDD